MYFILAITPRTRSFRLRAQNMWMAGPFNYAAHTAAQLGCKVAVVTRLAKEDDRVVEKFTQSGIDCFATYTPHSTLMKLEYPTTNPDIRHLSVAAIAGSITAGDVEKIEAKAAVIGSSLRGEVGVDVIRPLKDKELFVAADMQGFVRVLHGVELKYEPWDEMQSTLAYRRCGEKRCGRSGISHRRNRYFQSRQDYADMGPREIVLTHKDGLLIYADGKFHEMNFYPARLDGRSGRGDTCVGTYMAKRLSLAPREAGIWAAAVTSLKMENLGPFNRSIDEVEALSMPDTIMDRFSETQEKINTAQGRGICSLS